LPCSFKTPLLLTCSMVTFSSLPSSASRNIVPEAEQHTWRGYLKPHGLGLTAAAALAAQEASSSAYAGGSTRLAQPPVPSSEDRSVWQKEVRRK
jgi:hypothetical protein